jgi:hypothetical protein
VEDLVLDCQLQLSPTLSSNRRGLTSRGCSPDAREFAFHGRSSESERRRLIRPQRGDIGPIHSRE